MILELKNVHAHYGPSHILQGVDLSISEGETVAILGRNGAGKTTTMRTIVGLTKQSGEIRLRSDLISKDLAWQRARKGIAYVPEDRRIINGLTVEDNLRVAEWASEGKHPWTIARIYEHFPILRDRRKQEGTTLSGGQQQMLTIARALLANPAILLLDEPSQGLSPLMVKAIRKIVLDLAKTGLTIVIVEQNLQMALDLASRAYVMNKGKIVHEGRASDISGNKDMLKQYLGV